MNFAGTLHISKGVTAVIGSGGKTTLLHQLAQELSAVGTVVVCTTTHMLPSQTLPWLDTPDKREIGEALRQHPAIQVGHLLPDGKLAACSLSCAALSGLADYVLVEADGAKRLPLKAHAGFEPVIPESARLTICVAGASGFGQPIAQAVHRPELFCRLTGASPDDKAAAPLVGAALEAEALADIYYVNQVDEPFQLAQAAALAAQLRRPTYAGSLLAGTIQPVP